MKNVLIEQKTRVIHAAKPHAREVTMLRAGAHGHKRRVLVRTAASSAARPLFLRQADVLDERSPLGATLV